MSDTKTIRALVLAFAFFACGPRDDGAVDGGAGGGTAADAGGTGDGGAAGDADGGSGLPCSGPTQTITDLSYTGSDQAHKLDLYTPQEGTGCPLIIWIHGGGWMSGSKALQAGATARVLRHVPRGFALASINYRLSDMATFPAQIHDVKAAIRYLRANAAAHRINPNRIAVWGTSAGGHLAALAGTSAEVTSLEDLSQGNPSVSSRVQRVIDCYGPIELPAMDAQLLVNGCNANHDSATSAESKLLGCTQGLQTTMCQSAAEFANPSTWVSTDDPPFLLGHGTADCVVPNQQTRGLHATLLDAGVPASFHLREGGGHLIDSCPSDAEIDAFLAGL